MRHGDKINNLSRTAAHRKALLQNLANELIINKKIVTTLAKAKALRRFIEPLITKSKENTTHQNRIVFKYLQNKKTVKELFTSVAPKVGERPGGYTRIIKLGQRLGDNAEQALIEMVDYNSTYKNNVSGTDDKAKKTRRSRRKVTKTTPTNKEESSNSTVKADSKKS